MLQVYFDVTEEVLRKTVCTFGKTIHIFTVKTTRINLICDRMIYTYMVGRRAHFMFFHESSCKIVHAKQSGDAHYSVLTSKVCHFGGMGWVGSGLSVRSVRANLKRSLLNSSQT